MVQLIRLCHGIDAAAPKVLPLPDRAHLPLLCHTAQTGWGIVLDRDLNDLWLVVTPEGKFHLPDKTLTGVSAIVQLTAAQGVAGLAAGVGLAAHEVAQESFARHVRKTLLSYRSELLEAGLATAFMGFLALATSLFSMQVYDRVIPTRSEYTLIVLGIGVLLSILVELSIKFARSHIMDYVIVGVDNRLSREIFQRLLQVRVDQLPPSVGSLAGQMRGYEQVRGFYTSTTLFTLIDLPLGILFLLIIAAIGSPWVALVPLVFGFVSLAIGLSIKKKIAQVAKDGAALSNMKTGLLVEAVEGVETIKAGSGGWKFLSRWIGVNGMTIQSELRLRGATDSVGYLSATMQQISYAGLVIVGALVVMQGQMTMGAMIACSILSGRILAPIMALPNIMVQYAHASAAMDGLEKLYQLKIDNHGIDRPLAPSHLNGHYQLVDVKFSYFDNPPALVVPKLRVRPGERIAIMGPIGAGKSTLLRLLSGLYHPSVGKVLLDGLDLAHISRQVVSQKVGYLQQDHRLFQGTLRENLLIGMPDPGDDVITKAMQLTGMISFVATHPKGLSRPIMEGGKGLSGGQRQLLAFTRLILCSPGILLLDEPTATMDEEQERRCLAVLTEEAKAGKTLVIVTHKPSILPLVNRVIVVSGSSIVMDGPRDTVLQELSERSMAQAAAVRTIAPVA
jgi:ATP-binding cassette subfamily C protein LapB